MATYRPAALTVLLLAISVSGRAVQPTLILTRQDIPSFAGARAIVAGDFNRDGRIDLALANAGRNSVTILLNQGGGSTSFVQAYDVPVGPGPFDLASGDFDQDGWLDLAVTHGSGSSIAILRGAAGGFSRTDLSAPSSPRGIAVADWNKDGRLDIIVTGWNANAIQIFIGNGRGGFSAQSPIPTIAPRPQGIVVADFDHDGSLDLAVAHESGTGLVVLKGRAGAIVQMRPISGFGNVNVLATGDFNHDGWLDVAGASSSGSRVGVFLGGASGLRFAHAYTTGSAPRGIVARDINDDGLLDLVTANHDSNTVSVLLGNVAAPGTFEAADSFTAGAGSRALAAADLDSDGRVDLATGNQETSTATLLMNDTVFDRAAFSFHRLSLGTPSGSIGGSHATPADFNEDGKLDAVVKPDFITAGPVVQVLLTDGPAVPLRFERFPGDGDYLVADFNRDGHMDVLLLERSPSLLLLPYLGDGRGGFTKVPGTRVPLTEFGVTAGDLNQDAATDLVFSGYDASLATNFVQVLIGQGDGTFSFGGRVDTSDFTEALRIADKNRDGKLDVLGFVHGTLTVFRGNGTGQLTQASTTPFSNGFNQQLTLADLNHDGLLDAVIGEQQSVSVALGAASGFSTPMVIELKNVFSNESVVATADIDLDGNLDLIGGSGYIMRGRGDGTFEPQELFEWDGFDVHVADFNHDGLPDIIVPTTNGAYDVILNERNSINHRPTVSAGPDLTFDYAQQFGDEPLEITATGRDPDLHKLQFEWTDQSGQIVSSDATLRIGGLAHGIHTFKVTVRDNRGGTASDTVQITIVPTTEIVLWSIAAYEGTFSQVPDATAAGGERGYDQNLGRPKVTTPSANPANRALITFTADPTQTYKLWVRMKADGNHWANDSLWLQFSGATDVQGHPVYRTNTTSGLAVNLEECLGCGLSGWGWADDGWGAPNVNGVRLRFPGPGNQVLVIQTREDGVSFDQIVLSSEAYATSSPGPAKNDTTILRVTQVPEL